MKNDTAKEITFKAIPLWEVIVTFFTMLFLLLGMIEFVIVPLTKGNTTMQTQLILFMGMVLMIGEFVFHVKRSKCIKFSVSENKISIALNKGTHISSDQLLNITMHKFLFKKTLSFIVVINNHLYLVYPKEALSMQPSKEDTSISKQKIHDLRETIDNYGISSSSRVNAIPIFFNVSIYTILILALLIPIFVIGVILSGNSHLFEYFK